MVHSNSCKPKYPPVTASLRQPPLGKGAFFALICIFTHIIYGVKIMEILKYGGIAVLVIGALAILIFAAKTKKLFKTLLFNAFLGLAVMIIIDLTAKFTGAHIPRKLVDGRRLCRIRYTRCVRLSCFADYFYLIFLENVNRKCYIYLGRRASPAVFI